MTSNVRRNLPLWSCFEKSTDDSKTAICQTCFKVLSYKSSITNLKSHLRQKHKAVYQQYLQIRNAECKTITALARSDNGSDARASSDDEDCYLANLSSKSAQQRADCSESNGQEPLRKLQIVEPQNTSVTQRRNRAGSTKINLCLLKMIVHNFQPFSIINDEGFRAFTHAMNSNYKLPDRNTLSMKYLPKIYKKRLKEMKTIVQNNAKSVCVTVECWTSRSMDSFMGITAHFITEEPIELKSVFLQCNDFSDHSTGVTLYTEIKSILEDWDIYEEVNCIVTDNAINMLSAAKHFENDSVPHFECYAHKLNLVVQDALGEIQDCLTKVQTIVNHFRKCPIAKEKLLGYQKNVQHETEAKSVIQREPTRWTSIYIMLERFIELQEPLRRSIPQLLLTDLPFISMEEWNCIEQICVILKPFFEATVEMSRENYLVASKAIIITSSLMKICNNYSTQELYEPAEKLADKLREGITNRLGDMENNETLNLSSVLDPRFKLKAVKNKEHMKEVLKNKVMFEINSRNAPGHSDEAMPSPSHSHTSEPVPEPDPLTETVGSSKFSLWSEFDNETDESTSKPKKDEATEQIDKYLSENLLNRTECPFNYWQEREFIYPDLFALFIKYCNIVVACVPCQRLFTKSGYEMNERRARLPSTKMAELMFLNVNRID